MDRWQYRRLAARLICTCAAILSFAACQSSSVTSNNSRSAAVATTSGGATLNLAGTWTSSCVPAYFNLFNAGSYSKVYVYAETTVMMTGTYFSDSACARALGQLTLSLSDQVIGPDTLDPSRTDINYSYKSASLLVQDLAFFTPVLKLFFSQTKTCANVQVRVGGPQDVLSCLYNGQLNTYSLAKVINNHLHLGQDDGNGHDGTTASNRYQLLSNLSLTKNGATLAPYQPASDDLGNHVCFGIVGGALSEAYPAVVRLALPGAAGSSGTGTAGGDSASAGGYCTGTFISPYAVLTAAHCFRSTGATTAYLDPGKTPQGFPFIDELVYGIGIASTHVYTPAGFQNLNDSADAGSIVSSTLHADKLQDLAVVVFPKSLAPATMGLAATSMTASTPVTLVGYGVSSVSASGTGNDVGNDELKRVAQNTVARSSNGTILLLSQINASPSATSGAAGQGDSGGPLIAGNLIVGVANSILNDVNSGLGQSLYIDSVSDVLDGLIAQANQVGAQIPARGTTGQTLATAGSGCGG